MFQYPVRNYPSGFRHIKDVLLGRNIEVCHETIRFQVNISGWHLARSIQAEEYADASEYKDCCFGNGMAGVHCN